jgi:ADP-ribose pyrophosphatase YjhB (NUDIX family)
MIDNEKARKQSMTKDEYLVAVKLLLRDGDKLLITHDTFGQWDLPGGRIRRDQFTTPLQEVLAGKIKEELGENIRYELRDIKTTFRVEREEVGRAGEKVRIFGLGYEAKYNGGEIRLGEFHDKYEWIDINSVVLNDYKSSSGWVHLLGDYIEKSIL